MDIFKAGVQYDDFKGSVAMDRSDTESLRGFLRKEGVMDEREVLLGFRIASNSYDDADVTKIGLVAYIKPDMHDQNAKDSLRAEEVSMSPGRLFSLFKRFDLVATRHGEDLSGCEVDGPHWG